MHTHTGNQSLLKVIKQISFFPLIPKMYVDTDCKTLLLYLLFYCIFYCMLLHIIFYFI